MRYVIIRDDDTNALTPVVCLERLYRPFLDRGLPVNLATIPEVSTRATRADGRPEGFLLAQAAHAGGITRSATGSGQRPIRPRFDSLIRPQFPEPPAPEPLRRAEAGPAFAGADSLKPESRELVRFPSHAGEHLTDAPTLPLASNQHLVRYLLDNPGYHVLQHGCHHEYHEFDCPTRTEVCRRLEQGMARLLDAGFPRPHTFVAPYDRLSRVGMQEVAARFLVLSTGWFELARLPYRWWPRYAVKRLRHSPHWRVGRTLLLSHPGCLLSCDRSVSTMLGAITAQLEHQQLTVLVTHWWEYFRDGQPDQPFIDLLHETAIYIATHPGLKAISFNDLAAQRVQF